MTVVTTADSSYQENKFQTLWFFCLFLTVSISIIIFLPWTVSNITIIIIRGRSLTLKWLIKSTFDFSHIHKRSPQETIRIWFGRFKARWSRTTNLSLIKQICKSNLYLIKVPRMNFVFLSFLSAAGIPPSNFTNNVRHEGEVPLFCASSGALLLLIFEQKFRAVGRALKLRVIKWVCVCMSVSVTNTGEQIMKP